MRDPKATIEQRNHPRLAAAVPVVVRIASWPTLEATTIDVSAGGICLLLSHPIVPGDQLLFAVGDPENHERRLVGTVCHVSLTAEGVYRTGICWVEGAHKARRMVAKLGPHSKKSHQK